MMIILFFSPWRCLRLRRNSPRPRQISRRHEISGTQGIKLRREFGEESVSNHRSPAGAIYSIAAKKKAIFEMAERRLLGEAL